MIEIGALWSKVKEDGTVSLTGKLGSANVVIVKNKYKEKDTQPDYKILVVKPIEKQNQDKIPF